ncbi:hypothetical protein HDU83_009139 [Entophlyctis luteolus]|nr:hypothetical protein HDU83_009139 [Entophlyctis luteolus]KAJ3394271.1 hypothetical protein HDU84_009026 [Entophlyctis sp. JEL0112]
METAEVFDADPADAIDNLVHLESALEQSGWDDGHRDGLALGLVEGRDLGARIAGKTAFELGYYYGVTSELLCISQKGDDSNDGDSVIPKRGVKVLESLLTLIDSFPRFNDHEVDIIPLMENIRGKFKLATVLLKMPDLKFNPPLQEPATTMSSNITNSAVNPVKNLSF